MKKHILSITLFLAGTISFVFAEQKTEKPDSLKEHRAVQVTFFTPMGTNGFMSHRVENTLSLNMLAGVSGGVTGLELGGLANISTGNISGAQIAGLVNGSMGTVHGTQIAGISNFNRWQFEGWQVAGISNMNTSDIKGAQLAGILNISTKSMTGSQLAGIANFNAGDMKGAQISGILNVAPGEMTGVQAGLINIGRNVHGFQLGLINIADSIDGGVPIGLLSFVRNGYHALELEANETFYLNASFKTGTEKFYNIFTAGVVTRDDVPYWAFGLGLGTIVPLSEKMNIDVDVISRHIYEERYWKRDTYGVNLINTLRLTASYGIGERLKVFGGPQLNVAVSGQKDETGQIVPVALARRGFFDYTGDRANVRMYAGFSAGIRF
ncbi:MAG: hypothetical protein OEX02_16525 [Cyclobacteriaceae bacterium]|nr:hypothetical protein [Cyclobacteriaceae bacterium]